MNPVASGNAEDGSDQPEPPDPDVIDTDPSRRYICYKEVLGKGAFKTVYKAFDEVDGVEVAWSQVRIDEVLLSPGDLQRLHAEVHLLETLNHANIMKFYAWWTDDDKKTVNIITELFTSGSLRQYRKKHKKVDLKAVKGWARQILSGLDYLHNLDPPVIHRDLKCDNIFINGNHGEVKIGDLGFATVMQKPNAHSVIGTPEFMAPELYDEEYTELIDIYSFGMCMLEMVTFEYPYSECTNSAQIYKKVSTGIKPAALSKVKDPEVKAFIEKCLVPANERLPARDLLKDPFLQVNGLNGIQRNYSFGIATDRILSLGDRCFVSEELGTSVMPFSMDVDDDDNLPPLITLIEDSSGADSIFPILEVYKKIKDSEFRLRGERNGTIHIELKLSIIDLKGPIRHVHLLFFLDNDTSLLAADEIVERLQLPKKDVKFIAELVDILLVNLVSGWKPCIGIDHMTTLYGNHTSIDEHKDLQLVDYGKNSVQPYQNNFDAGIVLDPPPCVDSSSTEGLGQPMHDAVVNMKMDDVDSHFDLGCYKMSVSDDLCSESSYISAVTVDGNNQKVPSTCMGSPLSHVDYNGCKIDGDVRGKLSGAPNCMHIDQIEGVDGVKASFSDSSDLEIVIEHDEALRMELEMIELQYQQAISDIQQKREQAVSAAKGRAVQKKQSLLH